MTDASCKLSCFMSVRSLFQLREKKEMIVLGIRVILHLAYVVFFLNCLLGKWKSFHDESFDFRLEAFGGKLVMSWLHCESFVFSWVLFVKKFV